MKALFFERHGGIEVLKYAEVPEPVAKPGEALIRVRAVALNHLDIWVRRGWNGLHLEMPHIGGSDIAGEVVSTGSDQSLPAGTRVMVCPGFVTGEDEWTRRGEESLSPNYKIIGEQVPGGMAEYTTVPLANVFRIPEHWSYEEAAAPLLVGMTCWRMLIRRAALQVGESVLIVGAGGGVNSLAILLAKHAGATVYCVAGGPKKKRKAEELGADYVLDYQEHRNWHAEIVKMTRGRGVDVVIDNVGAETISKSLRACTRGGRIVTVGNTKGHELNFDNRVLFSKQISLIGSTMGNRQDFIDAMQCYSHFPIRSLIDRVEPLSQGIQMLQFLEEGRQFGKIILQP